MKKLTMVSLYFRGTTYVRFLMLESGNKGAVLPLTILNAWLDELGVQRGQTYSIG